MKYSSLLLIIVSNVCFATNYYVKPDGNDSTGDGLSWETAWATPAHAIATTAAGTHSINIEAGEYNEAASHGITSAANGKTLTFIKSGSGDLIFSAGSGSTSIVSVADAADLSNVDIEFRDVIFTSDYASTIRMLYLFPNVSSITLRFTRCSNLVDDVNTSFQPFNIVACTVTDVDATTRNIYLTDCTFTAKGNLHFFGLVDCNTLYVDNCTLSHPDLAAGGGLCTPQGFTGDVSITDSTILINGGTGAGRVVLWVGSSATEINNVTFNGNTVYGGSGIVFDPIDLSPYNAIAEHNTLNTYGGGIRAGSNTTDAIYDMGYISFCNNTITQTGPVGGHGMLLGVGITGGRACDNVINMTASSAADGYGLVIKSTRSLITDNQVDAKYPLCLKGAQYCTIKNNSCYSSYTDGYAVYILDQPVYGGNPAKDTDYNIIESNSFDGGMGEYAFVVSIGATWTNTIINTNNYIAGGTGLSLIENVEYNTIAAIKGYYTTNGISNLYKKNAVNAVSLSPVYRTMRIPTNTVLMQNRIGAYPAIDFIKYKNIRVFH